MTKGVVQGPLSDSTLPSLFRLASRGASESKATYFLTVGGELVCISLAAIAKVFGQALAPAFVSFFHIRVEEVTFNGTQISSKDLTNTLAGFVLPAVFLGLAALLYLLRLIRRFDEFWRARRALAEAARELAWRFSMRAMPADLQAGAPLDEAASDAAFTATFDILRAQGDKLRLGPPDGPEISPAMSGLRNGPPAEQRRAYLNDRLGAAQEWYAKRAKQYRFRMGLFVVARFAAYIIGGGLIFFNALGSYGLGAMTTIAGALGTWLAAKHYDDLAQSYAIMAGNLNVLHDTAPEVAAAGAPGSAAPGSPTLPNTWAPFVDKIEMLLKGERQDWLRETKVK
jgi:hypothetical protein